MRAATQGNQDSASCAGPAATRAPGSRVNNPGIQNGETGAQQQSAVVAPTANRDAAVDDKVPLGDADLAIVDRRRRQAGASRASQPDVGARRRWIVDDEHVDCGQRPIVA